MSVEFSLRMLGPVKGFGSEFVGGIFAKYFETSGGLALTCSVEFSLIILGPVVGGSKFVWWKCR